jgi:hypothetical protein
MAAMTAVISTIRCIITAATMSTTSKIITVPSTSEIIDTLGVLSATLSLRTRLREMSPLSSSCLQPDAFINPGSGGIVSARGDGKTRRVHDHGEVGVVAVDAGDIQDTNLATSAAGQPIVIAFILLPVDPFCCNFVRKADLRLIAFRVGYLALPMDRLAGVIRVEEEL